MGKWDLRFMRLAQLVSTWSKDPSTQVGAVITDSSNRVISLGFNGLPRGLPDDASVLADREMKYRIIIHAEENALAFAQVPVTGCTLYVSPLAPCAPCAARIIQAGIRRVVAPHPSHLDTAALARWADDLKLSARMFARAKVDLDIIDLGMA